MKITVNNCQIELTTEQLAQIDAEVKRNQETPKLSKEDRFWGLINETTLKIDKVKYPASIFGFKDKEWWWEYNSKNQTLWVSYKQIWSVFEKEYGLDCYEIQSFIKIEVEKHFNCKGVTPKIFKTNYNEKVEKHFNCKGVTPECIGYEYRNMVEKHFNCKGVTPEKI